MKYKYTGPDPPPPGLAFWKFFITKIIIIYLILFYETGRDSYYLNRLTSMEF